MGKYIGEIDRTCKVCGKGYRALRSGSKYCSDGCHDEFTRIHSPVTKSCVVCGKEFTVNSAESINRKCCSSACGGKYRRNKRPLCLICGKECSTGKKFCSISCYHISRMKPKKEKVLKERVIYGNCLGCGDRLKRWGKKYCSSECYIKNKVFEIKERINLTCKYCGKIFSVLPSMASNKKFCSSECSWDYLRNHPKKNITMKKRYRIKAKPAQRFRVMERDKFRCVYCGCTSEHARLVVDHVYPQSKLSKGVGNNDINLVTCCEICNAGKSDKKLECLPDSVRNRISEYLVEVGYEEGKTAIQ